MAPSAINPAVFSSFVSEQRVDARHLGSLVVTGGKMPDSAGLLGAMMRAKERVGSMGKAKEEQTFLKGLGRWQHLTGGRR